MTLRVRDALVIHAVRSPLVRAESDGGLATLDPVDLLSQILSSLIERTGIDPAEVDEVITGCGCRTASEVSVIGRRSWIAAALPPHVPSTTVDRAGGASTQAVHFACQGILAGTYDIAIAAGIESPKLTGYAPRPVSQSRAAERMAQRYAIGQYDMDIYAERSRHRAQEVALAGEFHREISPIRVQSAAGACLLSSDELTSPATSADHVSDLPPAYPQRALRAHKREHHWNVTSANSARCGEGAAAMLLMSVQRARELGIAPRARIAGFANTADDPNHIVPGPISSTDLALKRAEISVDRLDHVEVNETFAAVPLAWQDAVGINTEFVNPRGGALALGDPAAASGIRMATTMLTALEDTGGRFGMYADWAADGSASATILECP